MNAKAKSSELHLLTKYEIMKPPVCFYFNGQSFKLQNRQALKKFISAIFIMEGVPLKDITYVFCSDKELLGINKEFLGHDLLTDIITFDLSREKSGITAEIYISIDRVKKNSKLFKVSFKNELHRVIFHGALHLCGHKDKSKKERMKMGKKEEVYLERYFD